MTTATKHIQAARRTAIMVLGSVCLAAGLAGCAAQASALHQEIAVTSTAQAQTATALASIAASLELTATALAEVSARDGFPAADDESRLEPDSAVATPISMGAPEPSPTPEPTPDNMTVVVTTPVSGPETPTPAPTASYTPVPTETVVAPNATPTPTLSPTPTPTDIPAPGGTPSPEPTQIPTTTPSPTPTATPTPPPAGPTTLVIECILFKGNVTRQPDEYVQIRNVGGETVDMGGWWLRDITTGFPTFTFPPFLLEPGEVIRVYTNEIHAEFGGFSFGYGNPIWNDLNPDTAALYAPSGTLVSTATYPPGC